MLFQPIQPWAFGFTPTLVSFALSQVIFAMQQEAEIDRKLIEGYNKPSVANSDESETE